MLDFSMDGLEDDDESVAVRWHQDRLLERRGQRFGLGFWNLESLPGAGNTSLCRQWQEYDSLFSST